MENGRLNDLFYVFTELVDKAIRKKVLEAIVSSRVVASGWRDKDGNGCLFILAGAAATDQSVINFLKLPYNCNEREYNYEKVDLPDPLSAKIAYVLGVPFRVVKIGFVTWDAMPEEEQKEFIGRIRDFLSQEKEKLPPPSRPLFQTTLILR